MTCISYLVAYKEIEYRYEVMLSCWDADPEQRPTFTQLVTTITSVLDPLADYLDVTTFVTGGKRQKQPS